MSDLEVALEECKVIGDENNVELAKITKGITDKLDKAILEYLGMVEQGDIPLPYLEQMGGKISALMYYCRPFVTQVGLRSKGAKRRKQQKIGDKLVELGKRDDKMTEKVKLALAESETAIDSDARDIYIEAHSILTDKMEDAKLVYEMIKLGIRAAINEQYQAKNDIIE